MFPDEPLLATEKPAQHERDDDDVVELSRDRDEVRYEVERQREVTGKADETCLLAPWHPRVAKQAAAENHAVRNQPGERPGALAAAGEHERHDEHGVENEKAADDGERPLPRGHEARLIRAA